MMEHLSTHALPSTGYVTCSCACQRCIAGECCLLPGGNTWTVPTIPAVPFAGGSGLVFDLTDADGRALPGYWRCACQTIVPPGVEHRCPA